MAQLLIVPRPRVPSGEKSGAQQRMAAHRTVELDRRVGVTRTLKADA
jgi:hypothetical protein